MDLDNLDYSKKDETQADRYAISKTGSIFLGTEWSKRDSENKIVHLVGGFHHNTMKEILTSYGQVVNPGNLKTPLQRTMTSIQRMVTVISL